jgi:hypothetical protein
MEDAKTLVRNLLKGVVFPALGSEAYRARLFARVRRAFRDWGVPHAEFKQRVVPELCKELDRLQGLRTPARTEQPRERREYNFFAHIKRRYGLSQTEFLRMLTGQGSRCALCQTELVLYGDCPPVVDHCHETGKVRGLLCRACNSKLPTQSASELKAAHQAYLMR